MSNQFSEFRSNVLDLFQQVLLLIDRRSSEDVISGDDAQNSDGVATTLKDNLKVFMSGKLYLVICGAFKQGKSQILNALLDQSTPLFPVDVDIATRLVSTISYAENEKIIVYIGEDKDIVDVNISKEDIPKYVTERGNPGNQKGAQLLSIESPIENLKSGLVLVDTPGLESLHEEHTIVTRNFLPNADVILFVTDALVPLTSTEMDTIADLNKRCKKVIYVVTKTDLVLNTQESVEDVKMKIAARLEVLPSRVPVVGVSSKNKIEYVKSNDPLDLQDSNFTELEKIIWKELSAEQGRITILSALDKLSQAIQNIEFPIVFELNVLNEKNEKDRLKFAEMAKTEMERLKYLANQQDKWRKDMDVYISTVRKEIELFIINQSNKIRTDHIDLLIEPDDLVDPSKTVQKISGEFAQLRRNIEDKFESTRIKLYEVLEKETNVKLNDLSFSLTDWNVKIPQDALDQSGLKKSDPGPNPTSPGKKSWIGSAFGYVGGVVEGMINSVPIVGPLYRGIKGVFARDQRDGNIRKKEEWIEATRAFEKDRAKSFRKVKIIIDKYFQDSVFNLKRSVDSAISPIRESVISDFSKQMKQRQATIEVALKKADSIHSMNQEQKKLKVDKLRSDLNKLNEVKRKAHIIIDTLNRI